MYSSAPYCPQRSWHPPLATPLLTAAPGRAIACRISIHAPAGGATRLRGENALLLQFQSTRPQGARRHSIRVVSTSALFQSTRPQGARLSFELRSAGKIVSIHAPAGGATSQGGERDSIFMVSIHAPAGGATLTRR